MTAEGSELARLRLQAACAMFQRCQIHSFATFWHSEPVLIRAASWRNMASRRKGGVRWPRLPLCPRQQLPLWLASWPACRRKVFWTLRRPGTATTCGGKSPVPFLLMAKLSPLRSSCAEFADHARLCVPLRQPFRDYVVPLHVELSVCRPCAETPHTELLQSCDVCRRAATWQRFEA